MGTFWSAVVDVPDGSDGQAMAELIQAQLDAVDLAMSTWKEDSDLSRFNRARAGETVEVSQLTLEVLELCGPLEAATSGAFDPTVGPLVRLWGFGSYSEVEAPSDESVTAAMALIDLNAVEAKGLTLTKSQEGVELDFSAVAKGHAVDLAAEALLAAGCESFLLEVGGEMVLRGQNASGDPWRVGVDDPLPPAGSEPNSPLNFAPRPPFARLSVTDRAVATSGDYRNVREVNGRIIAHAIDPRSGRPIEHSLASVTVVAETCAKADALATAALVLGPEAGLRLLEEQADVEGYLLTRVGLGEALRLEAKETSGMGSLLLPPIPDAAESR